MSTARRLSIIALTVLFAAVGLHAGERATALVTAPQVGSTDVAPPPPRERPPSTRVRLKSPWGDPEETLSGPERLEREKTLAWLLLLLKEPRRAR
jgi:hypothetical protein